MASIDDVAVKNKRVLTFIETTFDKILESIQKCPCGYPAITIRRISKVTPFYNLENSGVQWDIEDREVTYGWPGKNRDEAWRFGKVPMQSIEVQRQLYQLVSCKFCQKSITRSQEV